MSDRDTSYLLGLPFLLGPFSIIGGLISVIVLFVYGGIFFPLNEPETYNLWFYFIGIIPAWLGGSLLGWLIGLLIEIIGLIIEIRSYNKAKKFVHKLNLKSEYEWQMYIDKHSESLPDYISHTPHSTYKGWVSWDNFLGVSNSEVTKD